MRRTIGVGMACALLAFPGPATAQQKADGSAKQLAKYNGNNANVLKLTSDLNAAVTAAKNKSTAPAFVSARAEKAKRGGKYQLQVAVTDIDKVSQVATKAGLDVVDSFDMYGCRSLTVRTSDLLKLDALLEMPEVKQVAFEYLAHTHTGSVDGQADLALNATAAKSNFGVDGSGVRIGILSDTFNRVGTAGTLSGGFLSGTDSQLSGDLPASIRVVDIGPGSGSDEGRGMAELVHDVAPGADLSWASAFSGYTQFATNILALATDTGYECDIIVDDVGYFVSPMYQDGPIAQAYQDAFDLYGVACFSSAGNNASNAHEGVYTDINPGSDETLTLPGGDDLHDFGGGDTHLQISLANNATVTVTLHWDEPYSGSSLGAGAGSEADFDLYLVTSTALPITAGIVAASSTTSQGTSGSPSGDPVEVLQYTNTTGSTETLHVVVDHFDGIDTSTIHVDINGATIVDSSLIGARTVYGHNSAAGVMGVAASNWIDIELGGGLSPTGGVDPESFTSLGGALPFKFDETGAPMATVTRNKPDITAPDGTNTSFFGQPTIFGGTPGLYKGEDDAFPNFFGTSAAAPHAAAVAALIMEALPGATASDVYTGLKGSAVDMNTGASDGTAAGYDYRTGFGYIDADAAIGITLPVELDMFAID
ncbi:MAG: hypothetical protein PWP23_1579 [Candidatus Sumerlaeota bacterium]|nr:hypothetical protein [Candidatus Sumerlaeota bacterium]